MDLLAYWKRENYEYDMRQSEGFHYNSRKPRIHDALKAGERWWLVGGRSGAAEIEYILLACLHVAWKTFNPPDDAYGKFRIVGDERQSAYYAPDGPDLTNPVLLRLGFFPYKPIRVSSKRDIAMSLRSMRSLTSADTRLLEQWAGGLETIQPGFRAPSVPT
jgi:hypothetical protein